MLIILFFFLLQKFYFILEYCPYGALKEPCEKKYSIEQINLFLV
jgi:hypothetical protein